MKKLILLAMAFSAGVFGQAEVITPQQTFSENFSGELPSESLLPEGWVTYGIGEPVAPAFEKFFGTEGSAPYYRTFTIEGVTAAWGCSTFKYAEDADEWLVTPAIHIENDEEVLQLRAVANGAYAPNRYRVLISEAGQERDSFNRIPVLNTTLTGWETMVRQSTSYVTLEGYAGKDICLAFVNKSNDAGMLGFTDIMVAPYIAEVTNLTDEAIQADTETSITANVKLHTPSETTGLTVHLTTTTGLDVTKEIDKTVNVHGTNFLISFDAISVPQGGLEYTMSLTPRIEGAEPTLVSGQIATPSTSYPAVAVIEEFTGTWCTNCPRGAAFMNYFHDYYDGNNGRIKAIGIALHSTNDPMLMEDESYIETAYNISGAPGYPSAFFNRTTMADPSDVYVIEDIAATRSNSIIRINRVDYTEGSPVSVDFEVENSFGKKSMNQRVAMVIIENNVRGNDMSYSQINGFSGVSRGAVEATYGNGMWPYFQDFCEGTNPLLFNKIAYNHVARGIYPDYYGELLDQPCEAEQPVSHTLSMPMPGQVDKAENTAVIVLLLDAETGKVLSAAEVEAEDYNKNLSAVKGVDAEADADIFVAGDKLSVNTPAQGVIEIFTIDGRKISATAVNEGTSVIDLPGISGVMIVSVRLDNGSHIVRRIIK